MDDFSGMRRFWPVRCAKDRMMDPEGIASVRDQLWAEAVHLYRAGHAWHLSEMASKAVADQSEAFRVVSPWEDPIRQFLADPEVRANHSFGFHVNDVLAKLSVPMDRRTDMRLIKVATGILSAMGCVKKQARVSGRKAWMWSFPT